MIINSPKDIPDCVFWLDASDTSTLFSNYSGDYIPFDTDIRSSRAGRRSTLVTDQKGNWLCLGIDSYINSQTGGVSWSVATDIQGSHYDYIKGAAYGDGKWVALGDRTSTPPYGYYVSTQTAGTSLIKHTLEYPLTAMSFSDVIYSNTYKRFISVCDTSDDTIHPNFAGMYSTTGTQWLSSSYNVATGGNGFKSLVEGTYMPSNRLVAVGTAGNHKFGYSDDGGETWKKGTWSSSGTTTLQAGHSWNKVAYGYDGGVNLPVNGRFVAVNINKLNTSYHQIAYSDNGINWTGVGVVGLSGLAAIAYGGGMFLALPSDISTAHEGLTSNNGIDWSVVTLNNNISTYANLGWTDVKYGNDMFVLAAGASTSADLAAVATIYYPSLSGDRFIGKWLDKSGNNRHFHSPSSVFTPTGGNRPLYISSLSTVRFATSWASYLTYYGDIYYPAQTTIALLSPTSPAARATIYSQAPSLTADITIYPPLMYAVTPIWDYRIHYGGDNGTYGLSLTNLNLQLASWSFGIPSRVPKIFNTITAVHTGPSGNIRYQVDDYIRSATSPIAKLDHTMNTSRLGNGIQSNRSIYSDRYATFELSEIVVFNRVLSNEEIESVHYYLGRKWHDVHPTSTRLVYPVVNSILSDTSTFSISGEPSPYNQFLPTDTILLNNKTVSADIDFNLTSYMGFTDSRIWQTASGGTLALTNNVTVTANVVRDATTNSYNAPLTLIPGATSTLVGDLSTFSTATTSKIVAYGDGVNSLTIDGNIYAPFWSISNGPAGIEWNSTSLLTINGDIDSAQHIPHLVKNLRSGDIVINGRILCGRFNSNQGGSVVVNQGSGTIYALSGVGLKDTYVLAGELMTGIKNISTGTVNITGDIYFTSGRTDTAARGCSNEGSGSINILGNIYVVPIRNGYGVYQTGTGVTSITGNIYLLNMDHPGSSHLATAKSISYGAYMTDGSLKVVCDEIVTEQIRGVGIHSTSVQQVSVINFKQLVNSFNGCQAVMAPNLFLEPTRTVPARISHASTTFTEKVDYWTDDSVFTYPASSDVVLGTLYNNNALTGTMIVPPQSSVIMGVPVGSQNILSDEILPNETYQIVTNGTTDFTLIGATNNIVGTYFTATKPGSGTSLVSKVGTVVLSPKDIWNIQLSALSAFPSTHVTQPLINALTTYSLTALRTGVSYREPKKLYLFSFADFWSDMLPWNDDIVLELEDNLVPQKVNDLVLWLDGNDSSTLYTDNGIARASNDGDSIYLWRDKSGNYNHVIKTNTTDRPVLNVSTNGINYKNTVTLDPGKHLTVNIPGLRTFSEITIIAVFTTSQSAAPDTNTLTIGGYGNIAVAGFGYPSYSGFCITSNTIVFTGETICISFDKPTDIDGRLGSTTYTRTGNKVQSLHFQTNSSGNQLYANNIGVVFDRFNKLNTNTDLSPQKSTYNLDDDYHIGALRGNGTIGGRHGIKIAEYLIYKRALTGDERNKIWEYLRVKWGIS